MGGIGFWIWWSSNQAKQPVKEVVIRASPPTRSQIQITNVVSRSIAPAPVQTLVSNTVAESIAGYPRRPRDVFEAQIALSRFAISSGSIDGTIGSQTRAALAAFQSKAGLPPTGELDSETRSQLSLSASPLTNHIVTTDDLALLQPLSKTWTEKSKQTALSFETILEMLAERSHASPKLIQRLNPTVNWSNVVVGTEVSMPLPEYPKPTNKAAFLIISLSKKQLEAFDAQTNLLAHFPCSIAARFDKRPVGELHVTSIAPNPDYTFNPEVFPESEEARQLTGKLILPPGPNNPVGTAWIGLDKPGYGMHGTPNPEQVGRTESHGCFRLANWNADYLIKLVSIGMPVQVLP